MRIADVLSLSLSLVVLSAAPAVAGNALVAGNAGSVSLGEHWGPYETYRGSSFRWVDNDALIVLHGQAGIARVAIACEGGPSLGRQSFPLRVLDASSHRQVDHVVCDGPDRRPEMLLPVSGAESRFVLHADGGGKRVPGEARILNFRVFSLDDGRAGAGGADVVDSRSGVRIGKNWFPLEHDRGLTFRWMANDGRLFVPADRAVRATLRMLLEVGPSVGARQAAITVRDARGTAVFHTTLKGRGVVIVPLQLEKGENEFAIGVESRNVRIPGEPRVLNLRMFNAAVLR